MRNGNSFMVAPQSAIDMHKTLPVGTYTVKFDQFKEIFYLEMINDFTVSGKIYGDTQRHSDRILSTFAARENSTGVMLSGEKGSGKTLLAKKLSLDAMKSGIPTIVINAPWSGEGFNSFMQLIEQPTVIIFDEFEKVYDNDSQQQLLTLFDGVYPSKKLFVITTNDKHRIDAHMKNRPGRIYYRIEYTGLSNDFIIEYCNDNLNDKSSTDSLCRVALMFDEFNFDMLKAMVEEMNRYGETAQQVMDILNAKPELGNGQLYDCALVLKDGSVPDKFEGGWKGNPLGRQLSIEYYVPGKKKPKKAVNDPFELPPLEGGWNTANFQAADLVRVDANGGTFEFVNAVGEKLSLTRQAAQVYDYSKFY